MKSVILLGASGSIGEQVLAILRAYPEAYEVKAIAVQKNINQAKKIMAEFNVTTAVVFDEQAAQTLRDEINIAGSEILSGMQGLIDICKSDGDIVFNALVGSVGVLPTLEALKAGKDVALANKETLVMAGDIVMRAVEQSVGRLLPVDSEHAALMQCLERNYDKELKKMIITASGGALRDKDLSEISQASVEQVLAHPNWSMGKKITVDSATMMNKGFEVIEAHHLFAVPYDKISTVLHKESQVHALCEYVDGSVLAHLGINDMRIPIQYALTYPERKSLHPPAFLDWEKANSLHFEPMDFRRYPLLAVTYEVGRTGGSLPAVLNAANEVAVNAFLHKQITFGDIETVIRAMLEKQQVISQPSLSELLAIDKNTRVETQIFIKTRHL